MADLSKPAECASFINAWRNHYGEKNADAFRRRMRRVADEQLRNLKETERLGRNTEEYARSVQMLEFAASDGMQANAMVSGRPEAKP